MASWISKSREKRSKKLARSAAIDRRKEKPLRKRGVLLGGLMWACAVYLVYVGGSLSYTTLLEGQKAPDTVVAAVDFSCRDIAGTELKLREAAQNVPPVFTINTAPYDNAVRSMEKLSRRVVDLRANDAALSEELVLKELNDTLDLLSLPLAASEALNLFSEGAEKDTEQAIVSALRSVWTEGILLPSDKESAFRSVAPSGRVSIRPAPGQSPLTRDVEALHTPGSAADAATAQATEALPHGDNVQGLLLHLFQTWTSANLVYDSQATELLREGAQRDAPPLDLKVLMGTTLVNRGEVVTGQSIELLQEHDRRLKNMESSYDRFFAILGKGALLLIGIIACGGMFRMLEPKLAERDGKIFLLLVISLLTLLPAKGLFYLSLQTRLIQPGLVLFLVPLGLAPLIATILVSARAALALGLWTSLACSVMYGTSFEIFASGVVITIVVALTAQDVRRRSTIFRIGLWIGLTKVLCVLSLAALHQPSWNTLGLQCAGALLSGQISALLALLFVPPLEMLFGITTGIRLLELSDMGNPLLQRLAIEAPGTYNHSLMVANLAQVAAVEIGANALLVRVCAYFHDIGKLTKPEFFSENSQYRDNPHDDLSPSMSTLVIISHVKEGISLARRHKLPPAIIDGIEQHHGTSMVTYFYHRAKKQLEAEKQAKAKTNGRTVNEEDFRYPGPKPQTREMGILLMADSIEATSRSMEKPSPNRIESMVNEIMDARIQDGQLDNTNLTLAELNAIRRSFVFTLSNMLHGRVAYPKDEDSDKQQSGKATDTQAGAQTPHPVAHGAGT